MEELKEIEAEEKKTFLKHVFSGKDEDNAEFINAIQYALMGVIPVIGLNKLVQNYIPDVEADKGSVELLLEIMIQIAVMFGGIIIIHRMITYFPTYSGYKYDTFSATTIILAFLVIVLSVQTKMGLKANILYERVLEFWNGEPRENMENNKNNKKRVNVSNQQAPMAQLEQEMIMTGPPAPIATNPPSNQPDLREVPDFGMSSGPVAANMLVGGGSSLF